MGFGDGVRVFDTQTSEKLHTLAGQALALGLSFSADGRHLASAWSDGRVQIWDAATGKEPAFLVLQHPKEISALERIELA